MNDYGEKCMNRVYQYIEYMIGKPCYKNNGTDILIYWVRNVNNDICHDMS